MIHQNKIIAIAYVPVLHRGYFDFVEKAKRIEVEHVYIIGDDILEAHEELDYLNRKDRLRAIPQAVVAEAISNVCGISTSVLDVSMLEEVREHGWDVVTPKEDIGSFLVEKYLTKNNVTHIDIFLRWHRDNTGENKAVESEYELIEDEFAREIMSNTEEEALKSPDWWRQIGAALLKNNEVIAYAHNEHDPKDEHITTVGDPRSLARRGTAIEVSVAAHAEVVLIGEAARQGVALEGAELFVTDFPCPYCARLIARSGIKKVYFKRGYAMLDGDMFLKEAGIKVVRVA